MTNTEELEDEALPPMQFKLRNPDGDASEITLHQPYLGHEMYVLIQAGKDGPEVEGSHVDLGELAFLFAWGLTAIRQSGDLSEEILEAVDEMLQAAEVES